MSEDFTPFIFVYTHIEKMYVYLLNQFLFKNTFWFKKNRQTQTINKDI